MSQGKCIMVEGNAMQDGESARLDDSDESSKGRVPDSLRIGLDVKGVAVLSSLPGTIFWYHDPLYYTRAASLSHPRPPLKHLVSSPTIPTVTWHLPSALASPAASPAPATRPSTSTRHLPSALFRCSCNNSTSPNIQRPAAFLRQWRR